MPTENENQEASWLDKAKAVAKVAAPYAYNAAKNLLPFPARILAEGVEAADNGTLGAGAALMSGALQQPVREALGISGKEVNETAFNEEQIDKIKRSVAAHYIQMGEKNKDRIDGYSINRAIDNFPSNEHTGNQWSGYFGALTGDKNDVLSSILGNFNYTRDENGNFTVNDKFDFGGAGKETPWLRKIMDYIAPENKDNSSRPSSTSINLNLGNLDNYIEDARNKIDTSENPIKYNAGSVKNGYIPYVAVK